MAVLSRSLGKMFTTTKTVSEYEEVLEDDDEYYEEIIIDDDGEEYYEEIIIDSPKGKKSGWQATQEQVDSMSLQNAKLYLLGLPNATGPTSVPPVDDDDYEYEEIEMPDVITPIRRSRRSSLFDAPKLDTLDEGNEQSEHSNASVLHSPGSTAGRRPGIRSTTGTLANIQESPTKIISPPPLNGAGQTSSEEQHAAESKTPKEEEETTSDVSPPGQSANTTPSLSLKSIQSENTATTANMSGSNSSLDLGQVFGDGTLPLSSPASTPPSGTSRKKHGSSSNLLVTSPKERFSESASEKQQSPSSLHSSGHGSERRRRRSSAPKPEDDDDNRSVKSKSGRSRRRSSESSKDREESVEAEIKQLVGDKESSRPRKTLGDVLSSPRPSSRGDSDNKSTMSSRSSKSRRRSSGASVSRPSSRPEKTKSSSESTKATPKPASTLADFLNMMPAEPKKRSDARSTISASRRRARTRSSEESKDRDCQSVAGLDLAAKNLKRSRSARRTKPKDETESSSSRTRRARSTSVGRKERLRRNRVKEATEKANAQHQAEKVDLPPKDDVPGISKSKSSSSEDGKDRVEQSKRHGSPKERLPSSEKSKGETDAPEKRDELRKRDSFAKSSRGSSSSLQKYEEGQVRSSSEKRKGEKEGSEKRDELKKRESFARGSRGSSSSLQKHDESQGRSSSEKPKRDKEGSEKREELKKRESFARGSRGSSSSLQKHGEDHDSYTSLTKTPTSSKEGRRPPMSRSGSGRDRGHDSHSASWTKTPTSAEGRKPSVSRSGSGGERRRLKSGVDRVQATPKRSSMKKEGDNYIFQLPFNDEAEGGFDGHMSFSRTLDLARSLHADSSHDQHERQSAGEGSLSSFVHDTELELNQLLSPGKKSHTGEEFDGNMSFSRTLELARSLHGTSPRPGPSDTDESERSHRSIRRPSRSKSGDSTDSGELLSPRRRSHESRSLGKHHHDAPVTPKTPRVPNRANLKKTHSSDDVLLVETDEDSCEHPVTPKERSRNHPSRSHSGRSPRDLVSTTSSRVYHSPREKLRRSTSSNTFLSPSNQHGSHSSGSAFSFQSPVQRTHSGSVESGSVSPLSTAKSTALERMKELEEIKSFLSAEEYEEKRREILASI